MFSRFAACRLRSPGDRRVNQNVGQATYTGIVTFPFKPGDILPASPPDLCARRREGRGDPVNDAVVRLGRLINSYGNNGTSLYCQPASSSVAARAAIRFARRRRFYPRKASRLPLANRSREENELHFYR